MENPASGIKSTATPHPQGKGTSPSASREPALDDPPPGQLWVDDNGFNPDPFRPFEGDPITMVWKGTGSEGRVVTAKATDPDQPFPVFGGDGTYLFNTRGTPFPVDGPIGDYIMYLGQVGGAVRGTLNVRKRTKDE